MGKCLLELFAGVRSIGKAFEKEGWNVISVDTDEKLTDCIHDDAYSYLKKPLDNIDAIWLSPMCTTYSVAGLKYHRAYDYNTNKYTRPVSDFAKECDILNAEMVKDLNRIIENTNIVVMLENPRGNLRYMDFMQNLKMECSEITYSSYGDTRLKPTNIWHSIPLQFRPLDKPGSSNHIPYKTMNWDGTVTYGTHAKKSGMRNRSIIPADLCADIAKQVTAYLGGING